MDLPGPQNKIVRFGLFETDVQRRALTRGGVRVRIQEQPFQILVLLLERHGEIVSREEIQQKLWPADTYVAFDDGLNTAIKKLRLALETRPKILHSLKPFPAGDIAFLPPQYLRRDRRKILRVLQMSPALTMGRFLMSLANLKR